jgi:tRNA(fMet)-specific endonuclease VapC
LRQRGCGYCSKCPEVKRSVEQLGQSLILPYDGPAAAHFQILRQLKLGIGTMDTKIAAIVLANGAKLLSRNLRDFERVPGLDVEDWV